jgi:hypothetical protein
MRELAYFLGLMLLFLFGAVISTTVERMSIKEDCDRLGAFFIGTKTYKCIAIEEENND